MTLGKKILVLRNDRSLSQEKLAEIAGVSRQSVTKWESDECIPEIDKLIVLSDYFGVSVDSIVRENEECRAALVQQVGSDRESIIQFLCRAKVSTYAGHGNETVSSRIGSHDLRFEEGGLNYYDTYLGGERFSGEEAVWSEGTPVWAMNYTGRVLGAGFSGEFLKESLRLVSPSLPFRGPNLFKKGEFIYYCSVDGTFDWFKGSEEIFHNSVRVYECNFHGGKVV